VCFLRTKGTPYINCVSYHGGVVGNSRILGCDAGQLHEWFMNFLALEKEGTTLLGNIANH
jgi:hypothetical protein